MPLPIIHSYVGYQIYKYSLDREEERSWKMASVFMLLANLADMDMLPGMLVGNPELFHRSLTHSLGAALVSGLAAAFFLNRVKKLSFKKTFFVALFAYFSHVLLDYLSGSVRFMLWPLSIQVRPMPITTFFQHQHLAFIDCENLTQFCQLLISSALALRLIAEAVLVYMLFIFTRFIPGYRSLRQGAAISESPAFIAGLAIFLFMLTALIATQVAG